MKMCSCMRVPPSSLASTGPRAVSTWLKNLPSRSVVVSGVATSVPVQPGKDRLAHDLLELRLIQPGQFLGEHGHGLTVGAGKARDVAAPEDALGAERVDQLVHGLVHGRVRILVGG